MSRIELIYQLFTGRWERANVRDHSGEVLNKMQGFEWQRLREQSFSHVYLLGLFDTRGRVTVMEEEGANLENEEYRLPSPFAISDHQAVHPDLGDETELLKLIEKLHQEKLGVIVDFVPHHTGMDHPWVTDHPEYYVYEQGEMVRAFSGDVCKLNYENPDLRQEMTKVLLKIASWGVDGIRIDMAHLVPNHFWKEALSRVKADYPNIELIGEAYADNLLDLSVLHQLFEAGFDYIYHEPLFRNLKSYFQEDAPLSYVVGHLQHVIKSGEIHSLVEYLGNHDDPPISESVTYLEALFCLILFSPGPAMVFNGLLHGYYERLGHHYLDILSSSFSFERPLPKSFKKIMALFKDERPIITGVHQVQERNLLLELTLHSGIGMAVLNLSDANLRLNALVSENSVGLLHSLKQKDSLKSGEAEVFLLD